MSSGIQVGKSNIHGNGIIATHNFQKGEVVFILKGKIKKLQIRNSKDSMLGPNWVGLAKELWLDPDYPFMYLNHSCNPNIGIKGKVTFRAIRYIKRGEELTFDYSITEDDIHWRFKCKCGSKQCRKIIRSIQFLPKKTYKDYLPYIPRYFSNVYNKEHKI